MRGCQVIFTWCYTFCSPQLRILRIKGQTLFQWYLCTHSNYWLLDCDKWTSQHHFHLLQGQTLGRLATLVAGHLRGSNLPTYTPSVDMGGYVVVINAEKVIVTGNKGSDKLYRRHTTGRPGKMKVSRDFQVNGVCGKDTERKYRSLFPPYTKPSMDSIGGFVCSALSIENIYRAEFWSGQLDRWKSKGRWDQYWKSARR